MKKETTRKVNLREYILGGQDGIVNVLGIVLGIASATSDSRIVILSGIVATVAESVSMGAVAYTSTKAARDYEDSIVEEEKKHLMTRFKHESEEVREIYSKKGFKGKLLDQIVKKITSDKKLMLKTMITEEYNIAQRTETPLKSGLIVGTVTLIGSLVPLVPFFLFNVKTGIIATLIFSAVVLFTVGAVKAKLSIGSWKKNGLELMLIGIISALLGYGVGLLLRVKPI